MSEDFKVSKGWFVLGTFLVLSGAFGVGSLLYRVTITWWWGPLKSLVTRKELEPDQILAEEVASRLGEIPGVSAIIHFTGRGYLVSILHKSIGRSMPLTIGSANVDLAQLKAISLSFFYKGCNAYKFSKHEVDALVDCVERHLKSPQAA